MKNRFLQKALHNFHKSEKLTFLTLTFRNRKDSFGDKSANNIDMAFKRIKIFIKEIKRINKKDFKYCYVWELTKKNGIHFHFLIENTLNKLIDIWIRQNPKSKKEAQKEIIIKKGENENIIKYISKYLSKQNQKFYKNRRVFIFSKNCNNPVKRNYQISTEELVEMANLKIDFVKEIEHYDRDKKEKGKNLGIVFIIDKRKNKNELMLKKILNIGNDARFLKMWFNDNLAIDATKKEFKKFI